MADKTNKEKHEFIERNVTGGEVLYLFDLYSPYHYEQIFKKC